MYKIYLSETNCRNEKPYTIWCELIPCGAFRWEDVTRLSDTMHRLRIRRGGEAVTTVRGFARGGDTVTASGYFKEATCGWRGFNSLYFCHAEAAFRWRLREVERLRGPEMWNSCDSSVTAIWELSEATRCEKNVKAVQNTLPRLSEQERLRELSDNLCRLPAYWLRGLRAGGEAVKAVLYLIQDTYRRRGCESCLIPWV